MRQNLRYALRRLEAEPGFALVVVLAMGLGIGMNTTVFTLVNAVLLRGLPYDKADELVVAESFDRQQRSGRGVSWSDFDDWQRDAQSFQGLAAMRNLAMNLSGNPGAPERAQGMRVTPNTFGLLGQPMHLGRDFVAADGEPGAPPVMIIGYGLWERRWAGDPNVIGSYVRVNEVPTQIVGVMQKGVRFPANSDAWVPLPRSMSDARDNRVLNVFGRLKPGVSIEQAETELNGIAARLEQAHPATNRNIEADVMTFNQRMNGGPIRAVFLMLLAAVSLLLLIACANVANLLIARAVARTREISVRIALGASRRTIIGQLLTESVTLGVLGGVLGFGLAWIGVSLFDRAVQDVGKPYWIVFSFDWRVFGWLAIACVGTGLIFGLAPALQLARTDTNEVLKDGTRGTTSGRGRRLTSSLVVLEMALTLALLAAAGGMIRSFLTLQSADLGARTDNVLTASLTLPDLKYPDMPSRLRFVDQLDERLRALPGVIAVSIGTAVPGDGVGTMTLDIDGEPRATTEAPGTTRVASVGPGFFETFGISAAQGRLLERTDGSTGREVVVVNQRFVDRFLGGGDPLGRRVMLRADETDTVWASVVGVVPHIRHSDLTANELDAVVYRPLAMSTTAGFTIAMRASQPAALLAASLRDTVTALDQDLPIFQIRTMAERLAQERWPFRVFGTLFVLFAVFGLVLSTIGMYAMTAYAVGQRRAEIGLRMALGAQQSQVSWLVLRRGLVQLGIGTPLGLLFAYLVMRGMESLLIGLRPGDPLTFVTIFLIVGTVTFAACLIPAVRAARMNPVGALRN